MTKCPAVTAAPTPPIIETRNHRSFGTETEAA
jgi:hypothetical protein